MFILTENNTQYDINCLPDLLEEDLRFCVLDYSNTDDVDFIFPVMVFLDIFMRPSALLKVGKYSVQVPLDWSLIIADKNSGAMELIDIKHLNDRDFTAFCYNPISGYMPSFLDVEIDNIFHDISWSVPKLINGHILAVPIQDGSEPLCIFIVKDVNRLSDNLDITKIF